MKRKTKKAINKKSTKIRSRMVGAALITTLLVGGTASQASAIDILKTIGDLRKSADSLIYKFKNDPTISSILGVLNQVTTIFSSEIQRFTNISTADLNRAKGLLGALAPSEVQKAIDEKDKAAGTVPIVDSQSQAARSSTMSASQNVLSKEGQSADKETLDQISKIVEDAGNVSKDSADNADAAQQAYSSQDVLKILASQSSNQAAINVAQLRLAALQNNNLQAIKTQLAVSNQANASFESRAQGETQQKILKEQEKLKAALNRLQSSYRVP